jgi:hypothetical protein
MEMPRGYNKPDQPRKDDERHYPGFEDLDIIRNPSRCGGEAQRNGWRGLRKVAHEDAGSR